MFDDLATFQAALATIEEPDESVRQTILKDWDTRTKIPGSLGRLEEVAAVVGAAQRRRIPLMTFQALRLFAGSHGVTSEGVSPCPDEINDQMYANFGIGGAAINCLCRSNNIEFKAIDAGLATPTANLRKGPAMTREETLQALALGWNSVPFKAHLFSVGEMGIGNTTAAAAIICAITGRSPKEVVGRGAGLDDAGVLRKIEVVEDSLKVNEEYCNTPFGILQAFGGREIAAMTGALLGACACHIPVVIDGIIAGAASALAFELAPQCRNYFIGGHCSFEPGHTSFLEHYGIEPLINLYMRLGEGTGAAVAMGIIRNAVDALNHMATFSEVGVIDVVNRG